MIKPYKEMLIEPIIQAIKSLDFSSIAAERKVLLNSFVDYLRTRAHRKEIINLNFICTHNSRRSHLSQVWAQTLAAYYGVQDVYCYSGGTETTAVFPAVLETLRNQGFEINQISEGENPILAIKYSENLAPIIAFSKKYHAEFNPKSDFAAIMTCSSADVGCPIVKGATVRFAIQYDDPKAFDNTPIQMQKYNERSIQIATEMAYVFSRAASNL